ncbi:MULTISPECIES: hypothetical protein [unclassified Pannonibacter]|uniref:hypothetical protein n=1 Tax=unclassified Pannonibacter TaxID=2627228 RepID=UPI00164755E6|nr:MULTISPECIES: hypothetical protein [unclassified Pannonibacter]
MPERTTPDTTALMAQLSYWSAYTEGVADTTNESYDHVLKNLASTYKDAVNAIRNDSGEDLVRVTSQFEAMVPAMEEFRGYDEGEQETRIVQAFDILKSDVEKHVNVRQQAEYIFQDLPGHLNRTAMDYMDHHPDTEGYPLKSETIVTDDSMEVSLAFAELGQNFDIKITKTVDDGAVRYEPFVTNNPPPGRRPRGAGQGSLGRAFQRC